LRRILARYDSQANMSLSGLKYKPFSGVDKRKNYRLSDIPQLVRALASPPPI